MRISGYATVVSLLVCAGASATQTVRLPAALCAGSGSIFVDDFDASGVIPHDPSLGSGGLYPGSRHRTVNVNAAGAQKYYLYVPAAYSPTQSMPLVIVLHGEAGSHTAANSQATVMRNYWSTPAARYGFIVMAPVSNGVQGGWVAPDGSGDVNDYDVIDAEITDAEQAYNIERSRISLWGFSAGADVGWDMLLKAGAYVRPTPLNESNLAVLASSAGSSAYACGGSASLCGTLFSALSRAVPVDMHIGLMDTQTLPWAQADRQRLLNNGWIEGQTLSYIEFNGGHSATAAQFAAQVDETGGFMCRFAEQP